MPLKPISDEPEESNTRLDRNADSDLSEQTENTVSDPLGMKQQSEELQEAISRYSKTKPTRKYIRRFKKA